MDHDLIARPAPAPLTQATNIYERLKADILSADLEPGRKLQLKFLIERYDAGQTPLREALNRLASEELVIGREQRGFFVKPISLEELSELTKTRCWVETIALQQSIANATVEWEEALLIAHHRLERTPRSLDPEQFQDNPEWERLHRRFHATLIGNCDSRPLMAFCSQLADRLYRYRALSIRKAFHVRKVTSEHKDMLTATIEHRTADAIALLQRHYQRTAEIIQSDLAQMDGLQV